jgi:hypothetical protein
MCADALYWDEVELLLNIVWLSVSIFSVVLCAMSFRKGHTKLTWSTTVALCLLLVVLFPVISITDDLQAMTATAEIEHVLRRAHDAPSLPMGGGVMGVAVLFSLALIVITLPNLRSIRVRTHGYPATLLTGFVRAIGVRPPPAAGLFAA